MSATQSLSGRVGNMKRNGTDPQDVFPNPGHRPSSFSGPRLPVGPPGPPPGGDGWPGDGGSDEEGEER